MIKQQSQFKNTLALMLIAGIIVCVWAFLLPAFAGNRQVASRIVELEVKGIDPSAMFYTELDVAEEISNRVEENARENSHLLWSWSNRQAE